MARENPLSFYGKLATALCRTRRITLLLHSPSAATEEDLTALKSLVSAFRQNFSPGALMNCYSGICATPCGEGGDCWVSSELNRQLTRRIKVKVWLGKSV